MTSQEKLLWAAFEHIKSDPRHYNQLNFISHSGCGTVGCLAYHICVVAGRPETSATWICRTAADLMGTATSFLNPLNNQKHASLFGVPDSYRDNFTGEQKIEWLEQHIQGWVNRYCKGGVK